MMVRALAALLVPAILVIVGCGGAAFGVIDTDGGGVAGDDVVDAIAPVDHAPDQVDAGAIADVVAADKLEIGDADAAAGDVVDACPASPAPLTACPIDAENGKTQPSYFVVFHWPGENCDLVATPPACLCDYSCACIAGAYACAVGSTMTCTADASGVLVKCSP